MSGRRAVLVTGVASYWGKRVAARLAAQEGIHVIGLDAKQPTGERNGLDFVLADVRNPLLVDLLKAEEVDTVCHLAFVHSIRRSESAFDANVMGTAKLLSACAEAGVRKVVLKSSTAVYGAQPTNPAFLSEDHPLQGSRRYGYTRDMVEIETFCNGLRRRAPAMVLTILRFASIVGAAANTPMTRFLRVRWTPSMMGFDPMMQVIHEDDVVAALVHAVGHDVPGVFNVAAEEVLPLSKIRGLVGKPPVSIFHPCADWGITLLSTARIDVERCLPIEPDYLRYPWVSDLARMRHELAFAPRYTAVEVLRDFAAHLRLGRYRTGPGSLAQDADHMREVIRRRTLPSPGTTSRESAASAGGDNE